MAFYRRRPRPDAEKCADPAKARASALETLAGQEVSANMLYERLCRRYTEQAAAAAVAGGMLGIKPILAVIEGKVALAGKARGLPGVYVALFKKIDEMGGIHPGYTPLLGYTVNHRELQPLLTYLQDNLHLDAPLVRQIGCVIGTHTGPGAFGIAFFDKELTLE